MRRDLEQDNGHSSDLDQRRSGTLLVKNTPQGEWDRIAEQMMLTFAGSQQPVFRSTSPLSRGVLKSKGGENCQYTIAPTRERLKLFFAQLFLLISSVFTEQSQICVNNETSAMMEQGDLLCQVWWRHTYLCPMTLHNQKKIYCKDIRNELKSYHNKIEWVARVMGSPRRAHNRQRRTREGPEPACVQTPFLVGVAHAGGELWINILPWYRPVGVAKGGRAGLPKKGKWPPFGTGMTVLTYPGSAPR